MLMISFMTCPNYHHERNQQYPLKRRLDQPCNQSAEAVTNKTLYSRWKSQHGSPVNSLIRATQFPHCLWSAFLL